MKDSPEYDALKKKITELEEQLVRQKKVEAMIDSSTDLSFLKERQIEKGIVTMAIEIAISTMQIEITSMTIKRETTPMAIKPPTLQTTT